MNETVGAALTTPMKKFADWWLHVMGYHVNLGRTWWVARCGKVMTGSQCSCGEIHRIRPSNNIKFKHNHSHYNE